MVRRRLGVRGGDSRGQPANGGRRPATPDSAARPGRRERPPLLVGQVTPRQLGVHPSRCCAHGDSPYIERDVDKTLADALRDGSRRLVVVQGPRLAGTTSTLAQAAQTYLAGHHVLVFVGDPRFTVAQMVAQGRRWADGAGAVLWLDDLTPAQLGQLDRALLDDLPAGLWILATVHDKHLEGFRAPEHVALLLEERGGLHRCRHDQRPGTGRGTRRGRLQRPAAGPRR